jgi:hypothetical protein
MLFLFWLLLVSASASPVFLTDTDYTFQNPTSYQIVYAEFSEENTRNRQFFAANFLKGEEILLEVFLPVATKDEVVVLQMTAHEREFPIQEPYKHDPITVVALKKIYKVETVATVNSTIVIEVVGRIKGAHYAVAIGRDSGVNILDYTISLAYITQRIRIWTRTFYLPFFFIAFSVIFLLLWPLSRARTWELLPKLAAFAYLSWIIDVLLQYFITIQFTNHKSILTFALHLLPNIVIIYFVVFSPVGKSNKQKEVFLGIGIGSLLIGGAGGYVGSVLLLTSAVKKITQFLNTKGSKEKLFCRV